APQERAGAGRGPPRRAAGCGRGRDDQSAGGAGGRDPGAAPGGGEAMNFFVADPDWGFWIVAYFFLGGVAAGSYFLGVLIEWFGPRDARPLAGIGYRIAFPLVLLCAVCLIVDLGRPERFWHMMFKSEVFKEALTSGFPFSGAGWALAARAPILKYWSPM